MSFPASEVTDPGGQDEGLVLDENENVSFSSATTMTGDFQCNSAITWEITKIVNDRYPETLGSIYTLCQDLLKSSGHIVALRQELALVPNTGFEIPLQHMFEKWLANPKTEKTTYDTLMGVLSAYDQGLVDELNEDDVREFMRGLVTKRVGTARTATSANESHVLPTETHPLMGSDLPLAENGTSCVNEPSATNSEVCLCVEPTNSATARVSPAAEISRRKTSKRKAYACFGLGLLFLGGVLIGFGIGWFRDDKTKGTITITPNATSTPPPLVSYFSNPATSSPKPTTPVSQPKPPSSHPESNVDLGVVDSEAYQGFSLTHPSAKSLSLVGCAKTMKQLFRISAESGQDWEQFLLPASCLTENVYGLELSGDINPKSLYHLLATFPYIRELNFTGLSIYFGSNSNSGVNNLDTTSQERIKLSYLKRILIHDGPVQREFYDFLTTQLDMPSVEVLTLETTRIRPHVLRPVQELIMKASQSRRITRLNLYSLNIGEQKLFNETMCNDFPSQLEIHVRLSNVESGSKIPLKVNLREFKGCAVRTLYKYNYD